MYCQEKGMSMCRKWLLLFSTTCFALFIALVWTSLVSSTVFAATHAGTKSGANTYNNGYQQGYQNACSDNGVTVETVPQAPAAVGQQTYDAGYRQGYREGTRACSSSTPVSGGYSPPGGVPYAVTGMPYGGGAGPYGGGGMPYGNYGGYGNTGYGYPPAPISGYSSPEGSLTPAYGSNNAPLFNIQTNITVSGNH